LRAQVNQHIVRVDSGLQFVGGNDLREEFGGVVVIIHFFVGRQHCVAHENIRRDTCEMSILSTRANGEQWLFRYLRLTSLSRVPLPI
jgi:hypothetical protein